MPRLDSGTLNVMSREIAFALIVTCPSTLLLRVDIALTEALDLNEPTPRGSRRDLVVPLRECGRGRGVGWRGTRYVHVDIDQLRAVRVQRFWTV